MILLNEKKVAFIHIPKNGGTSIRAYLNTMDEVVYNEAEDTFFVLGDDKFDKNHITLDMLHENFKTAFDLIKQYNSFCILRDPRERFYSSINQYFRFNKYKILAKIFRFLYRVFKSVNLNFSEKQISHIKSILFANKDVFVENINNKAEIDSFIDDYYSKDIELIRSL